MTIQNILNMAGLVINMIGAFMMYHYAPKIDSATWLYQREELAQIKKRDAVKNKMARRGMLLLFVGFIFQIAAFFL